MKVEIRRTATSNGDTEISERLEKLIDKYHKQIELQLQQMN